MVSVTPALEHQQAELSGSDDAFLLSERLDGEKEAGEQNEERSAERRVPGAAGQAEAVLQDRQRLQGGETNSSQLRVGPSEHGCSFSSLSRTLRTWLQAN